MKTRWYDILFRLEVAHDFYENGVSKDIRFSPTSETARKIAGHGYLLKYQNEMPLLLFEATDDARTPKLPISGEAVFVFSGKLRNSYFSNFTQLPAKESGQVYLYDNLNNSTELQVQTVKIKPSVFTFSFETSRVNVDLEITDRDGNIIFNESLHSSSRKFNEILKLNGIRGLHRITATTTQGTEIDEMIYVSDALFNEKPWCIVEIFQKGAEQFDYSQETVFQMVFQSQQKPWQYHLKLTQGYQSATFVIEDMENFGAPHSHPYVKIDFAETSGNQTYEAGQTVIFQTENGGNPQEIPFYEKPKKDLQLTISNGSGDTVIRPLPVPSAEGLRQEVYMNL